MRGKACETAKNFLCDRKGGADFIFASQAVILYSVLHHEGCTPPGPQLDVPAQPLLWVRAPRDPERTVWSKKGESRTIYGNHIFS